jgi:signal transduction histidine kinase
MTARHFANKIYQSVFYLAAGLIYAAVFMRTFLLYRDTQALGQVLGLLLLFLILFLVELALRRQWSYWFTIYLLLQTILVTFLIYIPTFAEDYFSLLYAILGMQVMQRTSLNRGVLFIVIFLALIGYRFLRFLDPLEGVTLLLLFGSIIVFLASYSLATRRAQEATKESQSLRQQLEEANQQLEQFTDTQKKLSVARERQRLARELHDSVTQTIFSMTLTTQSAILLLDKDPDRLGRQFERLDQLAQSAMSEIQTLISELGPEQVTGGGLVTALRQHITSQQIKEGLSVSLEVEGELELPQYEVQGLFRIVQEALNNVVKHANTRNANLQLHMDEPFWIEVNDEGQGFDPQQALDGGHVGLASMRERAEEIGWDITIQSAPGAGTRVRVEKKHAIEERV